MFQSDGAHYVPHMIHEISQLFSSEDGVKQWSSEENCQQHPDVINRLVQIYNGMGDTDSTPLWKSLIDQSASVTELDEFVDANNIPDDDVYVKARRDYLEINGKWLPLKRRVNYISIEKYMTIAYMNTYMLNFHWFSKTVILNFRMFSLAMHLHVSLYV